MPSLDIVLPCYNPQSDWAETVANSWSSLQKALPQTNLNLILVNDGSPAEKLQGGLEYLEGSIPEMIYVDSQPNRGKGYALRQGVKAAQSELVIYTDIDFPYREESFLELYEKLRKEGYDVVAGVRDEKYYENVPGARKRISKLLRWMLRTFLRLQIADTQCGLKGFNQKGREVFLQTRIKRFLFDLEFIFLSSNDSDIRLAPCKVRLKEGVVFSKMNWGILLNESLNFSGIFFRGLWRRIFGRKKKKK